MAGVTSAVHGSRTETATRPLGASVLTAPTGASGEQRPISTRSTRTGLGEPTSGAAKPSHSTLPYGATTDIQKVQASLDRMKESGARGDRQDGGDGGGTAPFTYQAERVLGSGSFGVVYQAQVVETGETVAIKKVLQDKRYKNRELQIMQELKHPNIVELVHAFYTPGDKPGESYLNVVMEYCSDTVHQVLKHYNKMRQAVPHIFVQLYTYQMLRGAAHMHAIGICHRDIKPQNLLVDGKTHALKICDFGSAKKLSKGEPNVAYICSRFYRAPELIFGATDYSSLIDMWSIACVTGELILGQVLFPGDSGIDQLMEIIKILGTPTRDDLNSMNPNYLEFKFPQIKSHPWHKVFRSRTSPEAIDWISKLLQYNPKARPTGLQSCMHSFFDDLRDPTTRICGSKPLPDFLFWFSKEEFALMDDATRRKLVPEWAAVEQQGGVWQPRAGRSHAQKAHDKAAPRRGGSASPEEAAAGGAGAAALRELPRRSGSDPAGERAVRVSASQQAS